MTSQHLQQRRSLLKLAAASAATLWLPGSAWSQPKFAKDPFTLGVASGSPTHDSVVLWTRLVLSGEEPVTVQWQVAHEQVAHDDKFSRILQSGQTQAAPELAHSVHAEVASL